MILKSKDVPQTKRVKTFSGGKYFDVKVDEYVFNDFKVKKNANENIIKDGVVSEFIFSDFEKKIDKKEILKNESIRTERHLALDNGFNISPIVQRYRGMKNQEIEEDKERFENEVNNRLEMIKAQWMQMGYNDGKKAASEEVYFENARNIEMKLTDLEIMVREVVRTKQEIIKTQRNQIYQFLKTFVKWVIIRELKNDGEYLQRLLEKLISDLDSRENLVIKVQRSKIDTMPDVLASIQKKFSEIKNVRVMIDDDIDTEGLKVEASHAIIDGSLQVQFEAIDKIFDGIEIE
ncbi:MAG: hypothetical protein HQK52_02815 [Oligoflexia bacterium]|nr:hypothetical protein [Oligoflexia bacterium]